MANQQYQPLDLLRLPLHGERLIEASAGTGKTFTLAALYLRLLLGLDKVMCQQFNVTQLLVVTFTEAATRELRGRIRANIHDMRLACLRGYSHNLVCQRLLDEISDKQQAAHCLLLAERQMDEAAIFTIHGFCQRMLSLNAFESGMPFGQTIIEDETPLCQLACADFWRRSCYPLPLSMAAEISKHFLQPQDLLNIIRPFISTQLPRIHPAPVPQETLADRHQRIVELVKPVKAHWRAHSAQIASLITDSGINKNSYKSHHLAGWISKIDQWASQPDSCYQLPDCLYRFSQSLLTEKTKPGGKVPQHALFSDIDNLVKQSLTFVDLFIYQALTRISAGIAREKQRRGELGFNDMLKRLDQALHSEGGNLLAQAIREQFPLAMIDEFQDTDPLQYGIFRRIWCHQEHSALLFIGDPKQAIYSFRGADIFTYMQARNEVSARYTLDINWRSSPAMIACVNRLFSQRPNPFLFGEIPFIPVKPAEKNQQARFSWRGETQPAMKFWLLDQPVTSKEYKQKMAKVCAGQICHWLEAGACGDALLHESDHESRPLQASDITVLVRSRTEAELIREALNNCNIPSVYLSNRDSVFNTVQARELLWILHAALAPEQENILRRAMSASLLGFDAARIDSINQDEAVWDQLVESFTGYRKIWQHSGVMPMLHQLMSHYQIAENLLATAGGERQLTDLLHLGELLQQAAGTSGNQHALVRWLERQIAEPNGNIHSQQLRLESDHHVVQIVSIHKAKGLEYSLVWLPFIAAYRETRQAFYHDPHSLEQVWDLTSQPENLQQAQKERLAEDLRLLYVALTRAIWHCSIGIAPVVARVNSKNSELHHSAPGSLIQQGRPQHATELQHSLTRLCDAGNGDMQWITPQDSHPPYWRPPSTLPPALAARVVSRPVSDDWRVSSYSALLRHNTSQPLELTRLDLDAMNTSDSYDKPVSNELNIHNFPRGASPGSFLHHLLEQTDFTQPVDANRVGEQLSLAGYDAQWQPVLSQWLNILSGIELTPHGPTLSQLARRDKICEMAFWLPVKARADAATLDALTRRYDPLSAHCPPANFQTIHGMLKGFIDLVFRWQGRYYLLDYKSNWLGDNPQAYSHQAMAQAMCQHRYDLQYQLYSLALHRYLRHRLADYQYQRHAGGIIYLFLRGVMPGSHSGIYHTRLPAELINGLDNLFQATETNPV